MDRKGSWEDKKEEGDGSTDCLMLGCQFVVLGRDILICLLVSSGVNAKLFEPTWSTILDRWRKSKCFGRHMSHTGASKLNIIDPFTNTAAIAGHDSPFIRSSDAQTSLTSRALSQAATHAQDQPLTSARTHFRPVQFQSYTSASHLTHPSPPYYRRVRPCPSPSAHPPQVCAADRQQLLHTPGIEPAPSAFRTRRR